MSSANDLIAAIAAARHTLDDQIMSLRSYSERLDSLQSDVNATLKDGMTGADYEIGKSISQTKEQIDETLRQLREAEDALGRIRI